MASRGGVGLLKSFDQYISRSHLHLRVFLQLYFAFRHDSGERPSDHGEKPADCRERSVDSRKDCGTPFRGT